MAVDPEAGRGSSYFAGWRGDAWAVAGLLALFAALAGHYLARSWDSWMPGGWDGVAHFSIADLYSRQIFPAATGWLPEYFAGMPFPDFYPPLFYFFVAFLSHLGLPAAVAFLGLQTVASAAVPVLTYACARRLAGSKTAGLVAGALAIAFLVDRQPLASFGISLQATFGIGLSTQLLGFCFLLLFYFFFLEADTSPRQAVAAALCLAAVALTNVHVVWDAACLFVGLAVARTVAARGPRERWRSLALSTAVGGVAVLLAAFWLLPMLTRLDYVPTMALESPPPGLVIYAFFRLGVYLVLGGLAAWAHRDARALGLVGGLVLLLAFSSFPSARYFPDLALQPGRFLIAFQFLVPLLVGYLVASIRKLTAKPWVRATAALAAIAIFFAYIDRVDEPFGNLSPKQAEDYQRVLAALAGRTDGRVLVEMGTGSPSDSFGLQALVGRAGGHSLTTVFRESSMSVLFAAPLRNVYSARQDNFGVDTKIPSGEALARQEAAAQLARLSWFNVRYFALKTPVARERLFQLPGVVPIGPEGGWSTFELPDAGGGYAEALPASPVLTFARFSVKRRGDSEVDFIRLGEELFTAGRREPVLALARSGRLDREELAPFALVLVTDYRYDDLERAYAALESFSREHPLVLAESSDPLFARLAALAPDRPTVRIVQAGVVHDKAAASELCRRLFAELDAVRRPLPGLPAVSRVDMAGGHTVVELAARPSAPVPVWIKQSYLPNWKAASGEPVYLATPTLQLVWARGQKLELAYQKTLGPARWGAAVSLAALLICGLAWWRRPPAPEPPNGL